MMHSLLLLQLSCQATAETTTPRSQTADGFWSHWGDGRAEVVGYKLTQPRYGEPRAGEAVRARRRVDARARGKRRLVEYDPRRRARRVPVDLRP